MANSHPRPGGRYRERSWGERVRCRHPLLGLTAQRFRQRQYSSAPMSNGSGLVADGELDYAPSTRTALRHYRLTLKKDYSIASRAVLVETSSPSSCFGMMSISNG